MSKFPPYVVLVNPGKQNEFTDGAYWSRSSATHRRDVLQRDGEEAAIAKQDDEGNLTFEGVQP